MDAARNNSVIEQEDTHELAPKVKRTYGRKKDSGDASTDLGSHTTLSYRTRPDSPERREVFGGLLSSESISNDASDTFGWREKLALIDKQFDDAEGPVLNKFAQANRPSRTDKKDRLSHSTSTESSSSFNYETHPSSNPPPISSQSDPPSSGSSTIDLPKRKPSDFQLSPLERSEVVDDDARKSPLSRSHRTDVFGTSTSLVASDSEDEASIKHATSRKSHAFLLNQSDSLNPTGQHLKDRNEKPKERPNKVKKLSKKEEKESKKAHARIMADQSVSITKRAEQYTVEHLLRNVQQGQRFSGAKMCAASSDPIQEFTSSPFLNDKGTATDVEPAVGYSGPQLTSDDGVTALQPVLGHDAESTEELEANREKTLALLKQRVLESRQIRTESSESECDDLELTKESKGPSARRTKQSTALEKKLANVAGFRAGPAKHSSSVGVGSASQDRALKLAARPLFDDRENRRPRASVDHRDLKAAILSKAERQSMQLTKEKEEEWRRRGGKLVEKQRIALANKPLSLGRLAENLALRRKSNTAAEVAEENEMTRASSEDESDDDWKPLENGSASPSSARASINSDGLERPEDPVRDPLTNSDNAMEEPTENENEHPLQPRRRAGRPIKRTLLTDSDDERMNPDRPGGQVLVPETSVVIDNDDQNAPLSAGGYDEEDKENDTSLVIDSGDDKENAMLGHRVASFRTGRPFDLEERARLLSLSPGGDTGSPKIRRPLQARTLSDFDDPFARSPSTSTSPGTPKSKKTASAAGSPMSLQPAFNGRQFGGLTQLFHDEEGIPVDPPSTGLLQPAIRLEKKTYTETSPTQSPFVTRLSRPEGSPGTLLPSLEPMAKQRYNVQHDELSLTLDIKPQPRLDVTTQIRRRADRLFEKEQELVLEETSTSASSTISKQELYVSENGFLTQTRPEASTPLLYRKWTSPEELEQSSTGSTTRRLPLSTISLSDDIVSPSQQYLRRLVKGKAKEGPFDDEITLPTRSADHPSNAFTKLLDGARRTEKKRLKKLGRSDFVEGEAVESDEDEMFGFGQVAKHDEEDDSDDDDPEAVVENLLDDRSMDMEELAEDKVLEKVKEQLEEEDAALEKYHQAAVEGKYRSKRRGGGIALDDSESDDDEDEEARRLRRRMHKKRRIQGDKLEDLRKDEKARVFYDAYQRDIQEDDNEDFVHLASDDLVADNDNNSGDEEPPIITTTEIREQLRQAAREKNGGRKPFDAEDVEWVQLAGTSDEELDVKVKEIEDRPNRTVARRRVFGQLDVADIEDVSARKSGKLTEQQAAQLDAWRKEQSGRNISSGGLRAAITVTGHGSKTTSRSTGSRTVSRQQPGEVPARRKVAKTRSVLASVSDKHSRFGD